MSKFNVLLLDDYNTGKSSELKQFLYENAIQGMIIQGKRQTATDCSVMTGENTDTARLELYQLTGEGLLKKEGENI